MTKGYKVDVIIEDKLPAYRSLVGEPVYNLSFKVYRDGYALTDDELVAFWNKVATNSKSVVSNFAYPDHKIPPVVLSSPDGTIRVVQVDNEAKAKLAGLFSLSLLGSSQTPRLVANTAQFYSLDSQSQVEPIELDDGLFYGEAFASGMEEASLWGGLDVDTLGEGEAYLSRADLDKIAAGTRSSQAYGEMARGLGRVSLIKTIYDEIKQRDSFVPAFVETGLYKIGSAFGHVVSIPAAAWLFQSTRVATLTTSIPMIARFAQGLTGWGIATLAMRYIVEPQVKRLFYNDPSEKDLEMLLYNINTAVKNIAPLLPLDYQFTPRSALENAGQINENHAVQIQDELVFLSSGEGYQPRSVLLLPEPTVLTSFTAQYGQYGHPEFMGHLTLTHNGVPYGQLSAGIEVEEHARPTFIGSGLRIFQFNDNTNVDVHGAVRASSFNNYQAEMGVAVRQTWEDSSVQTQLGSNVFYNSAGIGGLALFAGATYAETTATVTAAATTSGAYTGALTVVSTNPIVMAIGASVGVCVLAKSAYDYYIDYRNSKRLPYLDYNNSTCVKLSDTMREVRRGSMSQVQRENLISLASKCLYQASDPKAVSLLKVMIHRLRYQNDDPIATWCDYKRPFEERFGSSYQAYLQFFNAKRSAILAKIDNFDIKSARQLCVEFKKEFPFETAPAELEHVLSNESLLLKAGRMLFHSDLIKADQYIKDTFPDDSKSIQVKLLQVEIKYCQQNYVESKTLAEDANKQFSGKTLSAEERECSLSLTKISIKAEARLGNNLHYLQEMMRKIDDGTRATVANDVSQINKEKYFDLYSRIQKIKDSDGLSEQEKSQQTESLSRELKDHQSKHYVFVRTEYEENNADNRLFSDCLGLGIAEGDYANTRLRIQQSFQVIRKEFNENTGHLAKEQAERLSMMADPAVTIAIQTKDPLDKSLAVDINKMKVSQESLPASDRSRAYVNLGHLSNKFLDSYHYFEQAFSLDQANEAAAVGYVDRLVMKGLYNKAASVCLAWKTANDNQVALDEKLEYVKQGRALRDTVFCISLGLKIFKSFNRWASHSNHFSDDTKAILGKIDKVVGFSSSVAMIVLQQKLRQTHQHIQGGKLTPEKGSGVSQLLRLQNLLLLINIAMPFIQMLGDRFLSREQYATLCQGLHYTSISADVGFGLSQAYSAFSFMEGQDYSNATGLDIGSGGETALQSLAIVSALAGIAKRQGFDRWRQEGKASTNGFWIAAEDICTLVGNEVVTLILCSPEAAYNTALWLAGPHVVAAGTALVKGAAVATKSGIGALSTAVTAGKVTTAAVVTGGVIVVAVVGGGVAYYFWSWKQWRENHLNNARVGLDKAWQNPQKMLDYLTESQQALNAVLKEYPDNIETKTLLAKVNVLLDVTNNNKIALEHKKTRCREQIKSSHKQDALGFRKTLIGLIIQEADQARLEKKDRKLVAASVDEGLQEIDILAQSAETQIDALWLKSILLEIKGDFKGVLSCFDQLEDKGNKLNQNFLSQITTRRSAIDERSNHMLGELGTSYQAGVDESYQQLLKVKTNDNEYNGPLYELANFTKEFKRVADQLEESASVALVVKWKSSIKQRFISRDVMLFFYEVQHYKAEISKAVTVWLQGFGNILQNLHDKRDEVVIDAGKFFETYAAKITEREREDLKEAKQLPICLPTGYQQKFMQHIKNCLLVLKNKVEAAVKNFESSTHDVIDNLDKKREVLKVALEDAKADLNAQLDNVMRSSYHTLWVKCTLDFLSQFVNTLLQTYSDCWATEVYPEMPKVTSPESMQCVYSLTEQRFKPKEQKRLLPDKAVPSKALLEQPGRSQFFNKSPVKKLGILLDAKQPPAFFQRGTGKQHTMLPPKPMTKSFLNTY